MKLLRNYILNRRHATTVEPIAKTWNSYNFENLDTAFSEIQFKQFASSDENAVKDFIEFQMYEAFK